MAIKLLRDWDVVSTFSENGNTLVIMGTPDSAFGLLWFSESNKDLLTMEDGSYPHGFAQVGYADSVVRMSYQEATQISVDLK